MSATLSEATKPDVERNTGHIYNQTYFQGGRGKSNYDNYVEQSRGPATMLGDTLFRFFRPASSMDMGCAVGHTVKRLREYGVEAHGTDISTWATQYANVPYIKQMDASRERYDRMYDLVYSYDVVEHIVPERLEFAVRNLWSCAQKDLLVVPATYEHGETSDPSEPTHMIFQPRSWWIDFFVRTLNCKYDEEATARFQSEEHSKVFSYTDRIMIFSRLSVPA